MITTYTGTLKIPKISDGRLSQLAEQIRFVTRHDDGAMWWTEHPSNLRGTSILWDPSHTSKVTKPLTPLYKTLTLHTFAYRGLFKPTVAEVMAFAPDDLDGLVAFSLVGQQDVAGLRANKRATEAGFHVSEVTWYTQQ